MKQYPFWIYILIFIAAQVTAGFMSFLGPVLMLLLANILAIFLCLLTRPPHGGLYSFVAALRPPRLRLTMLLVLLAPPSIFVVGWVQEMLPSLPDFMPGQTMNALLTTPLGLVTVCLAGPVSEELIFRAGVLGSLLRTQRPWVAVMWSAVFFAVVHVNPVQLPAAFCLGLLLGYAYWRTRSIAAPLFIHILNNILAASYPDTPVTDLFPSTSYGVAAVFASLLWIVCVLRASYRV